MNIVSIESNDNCCTVIGEKGQIRVLKKMKDTCGFSEYLKKENLYSNLDKSILVKKEKLKKIDNDNKVFSFISLLCILIGFIIQYFNILPNVLNTVFVLMSEMISFGNILGNYYEGNRIENKIKKINNHKNEILNNIFYLRKIMNLKEKTYFELDKNGDKDFYIDLICDSSALLFQYLEKNSIDEINNVKVVHYTNPYVTSEQYNVLFPPTFDQIKKAKEISNKVFKNGDIFTTRHQKFDQLSHTDYNNESENETNNKNKKYVKTFMI